MGTSASAHSLLEHARFLHELARALVRDSGATDDVVQDTYAAALDHPGAARSRGWLGTVARNFALRRLRSEKRRRRRETAVVRRGTVPATDETVARLEIERLLVDAVRALDEPYRTAVVQRYFEGKTPTEIARESGEKPRTIETRLRRALAMLRTRLDRDEHDWRRKVLPLLAATAGSLKIGAVAACLLVAALGVGAVAWSVRENSETAGTDGDVRARTMARNAAQPQEEASEPDPVGAPADAAARLPEDVRVLVYHLRKGARWKRQYVALELAKLGREALPALPVLIELLTHEENWWGNVRGPMEYALVAMAPDSLPAILKLAEHPDPRARASAMRILGKLRHEAAIPLLIERLGSEEKLDRKVAALALARFGDIAVRPLLDNLALPGTKDALRLIGKPAAVSVAVLLDDPDRAGPAAGALLVLGKNAVPAMEMIRRAASDSDHPGRFDLLELLQKLPASDEAKAILLDSARSDRARDRLVVAGSPGLSVDERVRLLDDPEVLVRIKAAASLRKSEEHEAAVVRTILADLGEESARLALFGLRAEVLKRYAADVVAAVEGLSPIQWDAKVVFTLARVGDVGIAALRRIESRVAKRWRPLLARYLEPEQRQPIAAITASSVADLAAQAETDETGLAISLLGRERSPAAGAALARILRQRSAKLWPRAIHALASPGAWAAPAVPALASLLETKHGCLAANTLAVTGPAARAAAPALIRATDSERWPLPLHAAIALVHVTDNVRPLAALLDADSYHLVDVLGQIRFLLRRPVAALVPTLLSLLSHPDFEIRLLAVQALRSVGGESAVATARLKAIADDPAQDERLRDATRGAWVWFR